MALPPEEPAEMAEQLMASMDQFAAAADAFAGMRQQLIDRGFTPEQAGQIVADVFHAGIWNRPKQQEEEPPPA